MREPRDKREKGGQRRRLTLNDMPFCRLLEEDENLAETRRAYVNEPAEDRRLAAQWEYDAGLATDLVNQAVSAAPGCEAPLPRDGSGPCPGAVLALAIDPLFAPALLTVGSVEYQLDRVEDAMDLFLALPPLPPETEDLAEMIGKAGDFLIDEGDYENARVLYAAASQHHLTVALHHNGLGYCAGKLGELDEAVAHSRRAVGLEPDDPRLLSDLGWSLVEAERNEEAKEVLERAAALSPPDDDQARKNLEELRRRKARRTAGPAETPNELESPDSS